MTVAHNALRFPRARFVAVELDPGNAELARANTAAWADRITLLQGAVWESDGEVPYEHDLGHEHGFKVTDTARSTTTALSMDTILSHVPPETRIDYVKMDVEGVEARLLKQDWLQRIDSIGLQVHDPYTLADCARELDAHGFDSRVIPRRKNYIVGVRRGL